MAASSSISFCVRASNTYARGSVSVGGGMALTAEEMVDTDSLRLRPNSSSLASKIGDGGAEISSLERSELENSSSAFL